jgi:predicted small lipoprotein YifL
MNSSLRATAALLVLLFLFGCGQSGPLFVPGDPSTVQPQPASQNATPQTTEEDDEDDTATANP